MVLSCRGFSSRGQRRPINHLHPSQTGSSSSSKLASPTVVHWLGQACLMCHHGHWNALCSCLPELSYAYVIRTFVITPCTVRIDNSELAQEDGFSSHLPRAPLAHAPNIRFLRKQLRSLAQSRNLATLSKDYFAPMNTIGANLSSQKRCP